MTTLNSESVKMEIRRDIYIECQRRIEIEDRFIEGKATQEEMMNFLN